MDSMHLDSYLEFGRLVNATKDAEEGSDIYDSYLHLFLLTRYDMGPIYTAGVRVEATKLQIASDDSKTDFDLVRPYLRFLKFDLPYEITMGTTARVVLPANTASRDIQTFKGGLGLAETVSFGKLNLQVVMEFQQNFHEKKTLDDEDKSVNTDKTAALTLKQNIKLSKKFSLILTGIYSTAWDYEGEMNESYYIDQSIAYDLNDSWGIYLTHSVTGPLFKYDEEGDPHQNFSLISPENSYLATGLTFNF